MVQSAPGDVLVLECYRPTYTYKPLSYSGGHGHIQVKLWCLLVELWSFLVPQGHP